MKKQRKSLVARRSIWPAVFACALGWAASTASAQVQARAQTQANPGRHCHGGQESRDHKTASKVVCFRVQYVLSGRIRSGDGSEGDVSNVTCSAPRAGRRTCTISVEISDGR